MELSDIAKVCHEANRAYCESIGDSSQLRWEDAPQWQRKSAIVGVRFHLDNPNAGAEGSHQCWMDHKLAEGWRHGPEKDPEIKTHPCLVPFSELPIEQRRKDMIFVGIVHALRSEVQLNGQ